MAQSKVLIQLNMQNEQIQIIQLDFGTQIGLLLNYEAMTKKILQKFKFVTSGKANIRLSIANFYNKQQKITIPIFSQKNWTTLIANMLERNIYQIQVIVVKAGQLRLKKQRQKKVPVEFDSDGSIESAQDENVKRAIIANTPSCPPYKGTEIVRCNFCHLSNKNKQRSKSAGPFYGPFKSNVYAHFLCLLWCSYVYTQNQTFQFFGVEKAVEASKKLVCNYCKQNGASFYCHKEACRKKAHFKCATEKEWFFNWENYKAFCPDQRMAPTQLSSGSKTRTITNRKNSKQQQLAKQEESIPQVLQLD